MKIAIIGTGKVGSALGTGWANAGHDIVFGSRQPKSDKAQALVKSIGEKACADTIAEACAWGEVVVLATPWSAVQDVLSQLDGRLSGKLLIDCTNPVGPGRQLVLGFTTSAGEQVAQWAKGAIVVKAFNTAGFDVMANPYFSGQKASMFYCGDDVDAKVTAARLISDIGFEPVDSGPLNVSRYLEPMTILWLSLVIGQGLGRNIAFKLLRR